MADQREAILAHACELYLEDGLDGFSMRKLARAVGVTAPALYRHYESKEEVLQDVIGEAYQRLAQNLYEALRGGSPEERLRMAGQGYLDFALQHSRLYEVLFASPDLMGMGAASEEIQQQGCAVGQFWIDRVRECTQTGILRAVDAGSVGLTLWAHAHGLISLYLSGMVPMDQEAFEQAYRESVNRMMVGLGTSEYGEVLAARERESAGVA